MANYRGRWMPKDCVDKWGEKQGTMASQMKKQFQANEKSMEASQQQISVAYSMIAETAAQLLQPMLDADTQQEFDAAIRKAMSMAAMFQGNGIPGLAPAPGAKHLGMNLSG
jgi:hypothetical protein